MPLNIIDMVLCSRNLVINCLLVPQKELEYKLNHRNYKKHWDMPDEFPDTRVIEAYKHPAVDESLEPFQWGEPDFEALKKFCEKRLNWDENKIYNLFEPLKKVKIYN